MKIFVEFQGNLRREKGETSNKAVSCFHKLCRGLLRRRFEEKFWEILGTNRCETCRNMKGLLELPSLELL
jgi:hypothetical protein